MSEDEDEMGDFIVDEEMGDGAEGDGGRSQAQARRRRRKALQGVMPGISGAMMEVRACACVCMCVFVCICVSACGEGRLCKG